MRTYIRNRIYCPKGRNHLFKQDKAYLSIVKDGKETAKAGFLRVTVQGRRVRSEYFLNGGLQLASHMSAKVRCEAACMFEGTEETKILSMTADGFHLRYSFLWQLPQPPSSVGRFRLYLPDGSVIVPEGEAEQIRQISIGNVEAQQESDMAKQTVEAEKEAKGEEQREITKQTMEAEKEAERKEQREIPKQTVEAEKETEGEEQAGQDYYLEKESEENSKLREISYIRDLSKLRVLERDLADLCYNSFLLHGFYQYRYFILTDEFIGVPDHFYEREAIAAKMMGFPYFIEAENLELCSLQNGLRDQKPENGSFGYYLRKRINN